MTIAEQIRSSRVALVGTAVLGGAALVSDFALVLGERVTHIPRFLLGLLVLGVYVHLTTRLRAGAPLPGFELPTWSAWKRWLLFLGAACIALAAATYGFEMIVADDSSHMPADLTGYATYSLVVYPIYEEVIYRLAICTPLAALVGPRLAIVIDGAIFAALHVAYGVLDPFNALGGLVLAWIFLRSRSLAVSVLAHTCGNAAILAGSLIYAHSG